jgi:hypothetical protein
LPQGKRRVSGWTSLVSHRPCVLSRWPGVACSSKSDMARPADAGPGSRLRSDPRKGRFGSS